MAECVALHEGEPIDGYLAPLPSGVKSRFGRFHLHDEVWLSSWILAIGSLLLGSTLVWLGSLLIPSGKFKAVMLGLAICVAGVVVILAGVGLGLLGMWGARYGMKRLPSMQLIPGLIVDVEPLRIIGLADLGKIPERQGVEFGLRFIEPWHLPSHPHEVGARIPCVAHYTDPGIDRYYFFAPYPIAFANGDAFDLDQCMARLGEAPFRRLEKLVARGDLPRREEWMIVVDRDDAWIEERDAATASRTAQKVQGRRAAPASD